MRNIIGFYKKFMLVEEDDIYFVVNRQDKRIVCISTDEEEANKIFIMLSKECINDDFKETEA